MNNVLFISNMLRIGGAEKLLYELVKFSKENNIKPTILILDNFTEEYYDKIYKQQNVKVVRARVQNIRNYRSPVRMAVSLIWRLKLKYFANRYFKSVHVIGMYNVDKVFYTLNHHHRFFWHVNNAIQFPGRKYPYLPKYFSNEQDNIVLINKYQEKEILEQYGTERVKAKFHFTKLFVVEDDTN